jgi:hypothetical protein
MTRRMSPVATVFSLLGFLLLGSSGAVSTLGLADIFSDHMVLQRHTQIRVWGHAVVGAQVTAALSGETGSTPQTAVADGDGR